MTKWPPFFKKYEALSAKILACRITQITQCLKAVNHVLQFPFPQPKGLPHIAKFLVYVYE